MHARIWLQTTAWRATSGITRTMWPVPATDDDEPRHYWTLSAMMMMSWASARMTSLRCVSLWDRDQGKTHADPTCWGRRTASSAGKEERRSAQSPVRSSREAVGVSGGCLGMRQYAPVGVVLWVILNAITKSLSWLPYSWEKDWFGPTWVLV